MSKVPFRLENKKLQTKNEELQVFFDGGGAANNISIGVVCPQTGYRFGMRGIKASKDQEKLTSNVGEWNALLCAMHYVLSYFKEIRDVNLAPRRVTFMGDSQLIVNQANGFYKIQKDTFKPFYEEMKTLKLLISRYCGPEFCDVEFRWIPRDDNHEADLAGHLKGFGLT